ncbi:MAG: protein kinase, partial [Planctomycetes bacterium]|nr:protein kinase [Planctomycetota bacterium]
KPPPGEVRSEFETRELPRRNPAKAPPPRESISAAKRREQLRKGKAPERIAQYEILEKVAAGGMGVVYKARHPDLDRVFALKILTPRGDTPTEALARFQREAKTASRLSHPNIVAVHDAGIEDDLPYLVMDYVDGPNLDGLLKEEGIGFRKAAQIAHSIALALHHAHKEGVVHRDVKPENIILDRKSGQPKITDFGIVKLEDEDEQSKLTQTGYTLGSPCYMSPEQAAGRHSEVGPQSDVYSLAATLYEMLCGEPPFDGDSIHEIMTKVVRVEAVSIDRKNPAVPRDLGVVCMKGLEKEVSRRYTTAREFADDLQRYLDEEPVRAKPVGILTQSLRVIRRNRLATFLVGVLLLAVVGSMITVAYHEQEERRIAFEQREAQVDQAVKLIALANEEEEDLLAKRRAWFEALRELEFVLRHAPDHVRALSLKRELVLTLGDHLLESGEASFAEFVFMAYGADIIDAAVIESRVRMAMLGEWEELAEEQERKGDLVAASELYRKGLRALREAGHSGDRLARRIRAIDRAIARARVADDVEDLVRLAKGSAVRGDHAAAVVAYRKALALVPNNPDLEARLQNQRQKARDSLREALLKVTAARARTNTVEFTGDRARVQTLIEKGDLAQRKGDRAASAEDFAGAARHLREALSHHQAGYVLATALRAEEEAAAQAKAAAQRNAARFAPRELGAARELTSRAKEAFRRADYAEATRLYTEAARSFRLASERGGDKRKVASSRERAQELRRKSLAALPKRLRTLTLQSAEDDFRRAERHYDDKEFEQARVLYEGAARTYREVLAQAPKIQAAHSAQSQARTLRKECEQEFALEFASDDFSRGRQAELEADSSLEKDPSESIQKYSEAVYRYKRALTKSRPHAGHKRKYLALLQDAVNRRQACLDEGVDWKEDFKTAEAFVEKARAWTTRKYWNGAMRSLTKAVQRYENCLPSR